MGRRSQMRDLTGNFPATLHLLYLTKQRDSNHAFTLGDSAMRSSLVLRVILPLALMVALFSACSRDPNVRKQKYFQSGQRYFDKGKYNEAAIEYVNALKIDPGFADAHFKLAESYLKMQQPLRAYNEFGAHG